jgi:hypothetical protein
MRAEHQAEDKQLILAEEIDCDAHQVLETASAGD